MNMKRWVDNVINGMVALTVVLLVWILVGFTSLAKFHVPSSSMEPTLLPGDKILVNKWIVGGRWIKKDNDNISVLRLPSVGKIKRNDILVFNYLYPDKKDSIGFCSGKYYVKRCLALPGDTLSIKNAIYDVNGQGAVVGILKEQKKLASILADSILTSRLDIKMHSYPRKDSLIQWDIRNFGPMWIPKKGVRIKLDDRNRSLYRIPIEWELGKKLKDTLVCEYTFCHDYYFMGGDNCIDSQDSRYWGVVPDDYIVGKVCLILNSVDKYTGETRWERFLKKVE